MAFKSDIRWPATVKLTVSGHQKRPSTLELNSPPPNRLEVHLEIFIGVVSQVKPEKDVEFIDFPIATFEST